MLATADIQSMTVEERLRSIEMLKLSLQPEADEDDIPDWHKDILAERMEKMNNGTAKYYTLEEVFRKLGRPGR